MQSINIFHKGIVTDLDYSKRDNQSWDLPTLNARVINRDGQGLIITNINSNAFDVTTDPDDTIGFELPLGYYPVGSCEYDGIAYILMWNDSEQKGELGCFPSPAMITGVDYSGSIPTTTYVTLGGPSTGFKRRYRPLVNYNTSAHRHPFRTEKFTLDPLKSVDMFAAPSSDGTVNLYMADGKNFSRVINNGFKSNGEIVDTHMYSEDSFPFYVSQTPLVNQTPEITALSSQNGGQMLSGNYHFYVRLVNDSFNRTHYLTERGPLSIFDGNPSYQSTIQGIRGDSGVSGRENVSGKKIDLTLSYIDTQYKYIEIVYCRHWSDITGVVVSEFKKIEKLFPISSSAMSISIVGSETTSIVDASEILTPPQRDLIPSAHTIVDGVYFGANYKSSPRHNDHLTEYAKRVVPFHSIQLLNRERAYIDDQNILNKVGYFRGEAYGLGMVYVFKGGIESEVYPICGVDDYTIAHTLINDGIYRFPSHNSEPIMDGVPLRIMGLIMDNDTTANSLGEKANDYYLANQSWFDANIEGFFFVRTDRFKNMQYQGLMMYGCRSYRSKTNGAYTGDYPGIVEQYEDSTILFDEETHGDSYRDSPQGLLAHGCSNIEYNHDTGSASYYSESSNTNGLSGLIKYSSEYAVWLGQDHKDHSKDKSMSTYWGANRTSTEGKIDSGGRTEAVWVKGESNRAHYNDSWMEDDEENGLVMPIWKGFFPATFVLNRNNTDRNVAKNHLRRAYYVEKKYGFISPDYQLDIESQSSGCSVFKKCYRPKYNENLDGYGLSPYIIGTSDPDVDTYPWWWIANTASLVKEIGSAISNIDCTDVDKFTRVTSAKNGFVSEYTDPGFEDNASYGFSQTSTCMYHWYKEGTPSMGAGNRSMSTVKYIGVTLESHVNDLNLRLGSLYNIDPESSAVTGNNIHDFFDLKNANYYRISQKFDMNQKTAGSRVFGGDCFLQETFFKVMSWRGSSWDLYNRDNESVWSGFDKDRRKTGLILGEVKDDTPVINFGHGLVVSIICENQFNCELRHESGDRTFYPKCGEDGLKSFAVANPDTSDKTESLAYNFGYSKVTSLKVYRKHNDTIPYTIEEFPTRIRWSDKISENSYVNSFRNLRVANYKDFDTSKGEIMRCFSHLGYLVSYQRDAINMHYVGQREAKINSEGETLFIGSGEMLASEVRSLSNTGIQHRDAVVKGDNGIISLDWKKRIINYVSLGEVGQTVTLTCRNYSQEKMITSYITKICEDFYKLTDVLGDLPDTMLNGIGINSGYDRKYSELYISIKYSGYSKTLIFSEIVDAFIGESSFVSPHYITLNNDFYSVYWNANKNSCNKFYLHDIEDHYQEFYGVSHDFFLSFISNGYSEEGNATMFSKRFAAIEVESAEIGFSDIEYKTLKQTGLHDNFDKNDSRFWMAPTYNEGKWKLPIKAQTSGSDFYSGDEFNTSSDMRGEWLKIQLRYNGNHNIFIKNLITNFEISNF